MANAEHLDILNQGVVAWNEWRNRNPEVSPDLRGAYLAWKKLIGVNFSKSFLQDVNLSMSDLQTSDLSKSNLASARLIGANLCRANLQSAFLYSADLTEVLLDSANLNGARLERANLSEARLVGADLSQADLIEANLYRAKAVGANFQKANFFEARLINTDLTEAILEQAYLRNSHLVETVLVNANLTGCRVYGISAWDLNLDGAVQLNLIITPQEQPCITVDNLEIAQFIYLLLNNEKIRDVINTITTKVVLILGRFTSERKAILDTIRDELRRQNYLPILFDFTKPASRDLTETVSILAHLARFIIADITDPSSVPQELETIVPNLPSVPIQPLLQSSHREYGMFEHFIRYPWVLPIAKYDDMDDLLSSLEEKVIAPAEIKAKELQKI